MYIPSQFKLFNQTIKVVYKRDLLDKHNCFGMWVYKRNTIYIQQSTKKHILTNEQIDQTLIHEFSHAALDLLGYSKLSEDEKLVSSLSNLIHQFVIQIH